jgi:hypothetical protein
VYFREETVGANAQLGGDSGCSVDEATQVTSMLCWQRREEEM